MIVISIIKSLAERLHSSPNGLVERRLLQLYFIFIRYYILPPRIRHLNRHTPLLVIADHNRTRECA